MAKNDRPGPRGPQPTNRAEIFSHKAIIWWLPLLYLLISSAFYLRTYDSAQVKITIMQMGGLALLTLWLSRLIEAGGAALTRNDLVCLSPFLAYLLVGILSFFHAPYHMASVDFFLRHFFFMSAALIVIYEFDAEGVDRLTRILVWTAWIAVGYGFLQFVDNTWFPPGLGKGIDPFVWRGAFGVRVFSTYGNPNFFGDFMVLIFPILLMQYWKTRSWNILALMAILVVDLIATRTKGAWVGFGMDILFFSVIALLYLQEFREIVAPYRKKILGAAAVAAIATVGILGPRLGATIRSINLVTSINFRLFTWEATWEMIMTQPLIGTGIGSFPPIYPAFRRPPIFHIEGKHNTETDHAEDEYLEQLFDNGILGFGVFLWMVLSTLVVGFRSLGQMTTQLLQKNGRPPPRAYDLVGYLVAFIGMLGHNFFDVSLRFVSSGVYLGLLSGMIVNLARGKGLYELHAGHNQPEAAKGPPPASPTWDLISEFLIWPARLAAWGGLLYIGYTLFKEFAELQGPLGRLGLGGEVLQWWIAWGVFAACVIGLIGIFLRLAFLSETPVVPLLILVMLYPLNMFWGYFKGDVHHNIAIFFSKERNWDMALSHYFQVEKLNPNFVMSLYFTGNVYNDRFDMRKVHNPAWGDKENIARDDYERAMNSYDKVRRLAPNYVQTHHQVGVLHMKRAEWALQQGRAQEAEVYFQRAMTRFRMYEQLDPVFAPNYFRMGQIYMFHKQYEEAAKTYLAFIQAEKCAVDPKLTAKPYLRDSLLYYQEYYQEAGNPLPIHRHEAAWRGGHEAYVDLGNALFMMDKFPEAEKAYKKGLTISPNYENAKKSLGMLYQKAQSLGRLRAVPPESASPENAPHTGYEVLPPKR